MKKSNLENSMIVKIRNGGFGLVFENKILFSKTFIYLKDFTEDLRVKSKRVELDIVKVYKPRTIFCLGDLMNIREIDLDLIWKREKEIDWKKVTFGIKVVVGDYEEDIYEINEYNVTHFISYDERIKEYPFMTVDNLKYDGVISYKYCRIHPDVEIKEEWYK